MFFKKIISKIFAKKLISVRRHIDRISNYIYFEYPFGKDLRADKNQYLKLSKIASKQVYPEIDDYERKLGYSINKKWLDDLALRTQIVIKESPLCYAHGRVLYSTLSNYLNKLIDKSNSVTIVETGTARGFSSICMAKSLEDNNYFGKILTFDVLPHNIKMYWNCIDDHEGPKSRSELLRSWRNLGEKYIIYHQSNTRIELPKVKTERVNFAFLDGVHSYDDVMFEFYQIKDFQRSGDVIVYDDYTQKQFPGLVKPVDNIYDKYNYHKTILKVHNNRGYVIAIKN